MARAPAARKRRRRTPEEAEGEILEAAAELLRERALHDVSVSAIMERTTLSRKSFYVYFRDRYELLTRLFRPLRRELDRANALSLERPTGDFIADSRAALVAIVEFHAGKDGPLVRALHEASAYDEEAARVWREFDEPVIAALTEMVSSEIAAGRLGGGVEVEPTIRALVGMNRYCFFDQVVGNPDVDVETVVSALVAVWARVFPPTAG